MLIVCLIIIAGVFVYFTKGFNFDMEYAKKDQIVLTNKTGFEISKIEDYNKGDDRQRSVLPALKKALFV